MLLTPHLVSLAEELLGVIEVAAVDVVEASPVMTKVRVKIWVSLFGLAFKFLMRKTKVRHAYTDLHSSFPRPQRWRCKQPW